MANTDRKKYKKKLALVLSIIFLISVFSGAYFLKLYLSLGGGPGVEKIEVKKPDEDKPTVILAVGVDQAKGDVGRSDTIILAFVNDEKATIDLLSIPRDTLVDIPGKKRDKINHAFAFGGMELTIKTVEEFAGVPVNYYVKTNLNGLKNIVDTLGGIDMDVEKKITVGGIIPGTKLTLKPGKQTLDGEQAVAYARFRNDAKGDYGRMARQQKVLKAIAKEMLQPSVVLKAPQLISDINKFVETNMGVSQMLKYSQLFKGSDSNSLKTHSLTGKGKRINGVSYIEIDDTKKEEIISELYQK